MVRNRVARAMLVVFVMLVMFVMLVAPRVD